MASVGEREMPARQWMRTDPFASRTLAVEQMIITPISRNKQHNYLISNNILSTNSFQSLICFKVDKPTYY